MKISVKLVLASAAVAIAAIVSAPRAHIALAQEGASGSNYKIGVVDMDEVLRGYTKLKTETEALDAERKKNQDQLDAKTEALQAKLEAAKNAPEAERERQRDEVETELRNFRADMQRMQGELDSKAQKLSARTRDEIINAIQLVGASEDYHLILEGDADGRSTVIYFTNTINITPKIIDKLNGGASAAAPKSSSQPARKAQ